jgi:integrase
MKIIATCSRQPWNKGKLVGQKTPLRLRDIWAIRVRLQIAERTRDLALFDLAIDSKLRACDLTKLRVRDVAHGEHVSSRAMVMQQKTQRPVQFEITEQTRSALAAWIHQAQLRSEDCLFPSRLHTSDHLSTRQLRIPRHLATQSTNIRPPVPRLSGQAVGAQRRRFALLV